MNKHIIYKNKHKRSLINNKETQKDRLIIFQNTEKEKEKPKEEETNQNNKIPFHKRIKIYLNKYKYPIIFFGSLIIIAIILAIVIPIVLKKYENDSDNQNILSPASIYISCFS